MTITAGTAQSNKTGIVASFVFAHEDQQLLVDVCSGFLVAEVTELPPVVSTEGHNRRFLVITGF